MKNTPSLVKNVTFTVPLAKALSLGAGAVGCPVAAFIRMAIIEKLRTLQGSDINALLDQHTAIRTARYTEARSRNLGAECGKCGLNWSPRSIVGGDGECPYCGCKEISRG